jgi:molybdate transport system substrate-binding protein
VSASLKILGAGAAQSVIGEVAASCGDQGWTIDAEYGGVHAMAARIVAGEPADVIVLTRDLVDDLAEAGALRGETRHDMGSVETALAVRAGTPLPNVATMDSLRRALLAATQIIHPDPAVATAGRSFIAAIDTLGIREAIAGRMVACANGAAAAQRVAAGGGGEIGVMQVTEVLAHRGLALAGTFPAPLRRDTIYCAAVSAHSRQLEVANAFIRRLVGSRTLLRSAGFSPLR